MYKFGIAAASSSSSFSASDFVSSKRIQNFNESWTLRRIFAHVPWRKRLNILQLLNVSKFSFWVENRHLVKEKIRFESKAAQCYATRDKDLYYFFSFFLSKSPIFFNRLYGQPKARRRSGKNVFLTIPHMCQTLSANCAKLRIVVESSADAEGSMDVWQNCMGAKLRF